MPSANTPAKAVALDGIEIFKPGRHTAMNGAVIEFTSADLVAMRDSYNPALHEAPHVIGHPKLDGPAYGWVESLAINDAGHLVVQTSRQVEPAFAELLGAGRFKKRSASFYPPAHPANPTPGSYYLKHVGHLGAVPPAIKGLADYAAEEDGVLEFGSWAEEATVSILRRLRDWMVSAFDLETADRVIPSYQLDAIQREVVLRPDDDNKFPTPAFAQGAPAVTILTPEQLAARQAELDARERGLAEREAAAAASAKAGRTADLTAFADRMVKEGRLLPAERATVVSFMEQLPEAAVVVEFGEGDAKTETPALKVYQDWLAALPPRVEFGERAANAAAVEPTDTSNAAAIGKAAIEFRESERQAGRDMSFELAVQHVVDKARVAA